MRRSLGERFRTQQAYWHQRCGFLLYGGKALSSRSKVIRTFSGKLFLRVLRPETTERLSKVLRLRQAAVSRCCWLLVERGGRSLRSALRLLCRALPRHSAIPMDSHQASILIRDWAWTQTAFLRWRHAAGEGEGDWVEKADLVILDWPAVDPASAHRAFYTIRAKDPIRPVLILKRGQGKDPMRDAAERTESHHRSTGCVSETTGRHAIWRSNACSYSPLPIGSAGPRRS